MGKPEALREKMRFQEPLKSVFIFCFGGTGGGEGGFWKLQQGWLPVSFSDANTSLSTGKKRISKDPRTLALTSRKRKRKLK